MLSHTNLVTSALGSLAAAPPLVPGGTVAHVAPLFHLAGIWPWLLQLMVGGRHCVVEASGGENVSSAEVENVVAARPAVAACAVIGVPDPEWGERVHAVVVLAPGVALTLDELRAHVTERIARYKAPRSLEIVEELPISGAGKILKGELWARHASSDEPDE